MTDVDCDKAILYKKYVHKLYRWLGLKYGALFGVTFGAISTFMVPLEIASWPIALFYCVTIFTLIFALIGYYFLPFFKFRLSLGNAGIQQFAHILAEHGVAPSFRDSPNNTANTYYSDISSDSSTD